MSNRDMNLELPKDILNLFDEITKRGFLVGIVGGFCRDFLLNGSMSKDIDLEIRPKGDVDTTDLYEYLQKTYSTKIHKTYNILTIDFDDYSVEMGLPRVESFTSDVGHSNFTVEFVRDLDFKIGYKRRDFTINAILFLYKDKQWTIIDPLDGVKDLENGLLVECDQETFSKDPVRCLRALRFSIRLNFKLNKYLTNQLSTFDPSTVTIHYLRMEARKSEHPILFLTSLFKLDCLVMSNKIFQDKVEQMVKVDPKLSLEDKTFLVDKLSYSKKGILKLMIGQSIKNLMTSNPEELEVSLILIEKASLSSEYLIYIFKNYFTDFNYNQFKIFLTTRYELTKEDKKSDSKAYRSIILRKRLEQSC